MYANCVNELFVRRTRAFGYKIEYRSTFIIARVVFEAVLVGVCVFPWLRYLRDLTADGLVLYLRYCFSSFCDIYYILRNIQNR